MIYRQQETHILMYTNMHTYMYTHALTNSHIHTCILTHTYTTTHVHTYVHIYKDVTERTKIQVPCGESSSHGCPGKTQGQYIRTSLSPSIPLRANKI